MREDLLDHISCPICKAVEFALETAVADTREVREGQIICCACKTTFPISKGIVDLMPNPDQTIQSEQQGWSELLGETSEELVNTMLQLPHYGEDNLWVSVAKSFDDIMDKVDFSGKKVLDVGAGRCWSTRHMVLAGASYAIGIDILTERFIGLETADIFLEHDGIYFERLIGDMNNLPIRPGTFDIAFMTATLHHTSDPKQAVKEMSIALKPGGMIILINEPVRGIRQKNVLDGCIEIEHGINENIYSLREYLQAARQAGLKPQIFLSPVVKDELNKNPNQIVHRFGRLGRYVLLPMWRYPLGQKLIAGPMLPFLHLIANMPLTMLAQKPS